MRALGPALKRILGPGWEGGGCAAHVRENPELERFYSGLLQQVSPKGNQPFVFIGRTDTEAEALILWPPDAKSELIGKDPDAGKD